MRFSRVDVEMDQNGPKAELDVNDVLGREGIEELIHQPKYQLWDDCGRALSGPSLTLTRSARPKMD